MRVRIDRRSLILWSALLVLFAGALAVRVVHLPHSRMISEVQFRSALIARSFYFSMERAIPEWRREINARSVERLPAKEPSVLPMAAALLYKASGGERLSIPRLLSTLAWLLGGVFLYLTSVRLLSPAAALAGTAYYLFVPLGVLTSTSFVSDPLMIMMFVISLHTMLRYHETLSTAWLLTCSVCSGLAILVKPLTLFVIVGSFVGLAAARASKLRDLLTVQLVVYLAIASILGTAYYFHGLFVGGGISRQAEVSFVPQLLAHPSFWLGWVRSAVGATGATPLFLGLLGVPLLRGRTEKWLLMGMLAGYLAFCLTFTFHIQYAAYYHLQLVVIVALAFGPLVNAVWGRLQGAVNRWYGWAPLVVAVALMAGVSARAIDADYSSYGDYESPSTGREIGEIVGHSDRVVYVASYYGRPLEYFGELSGTYWPRSATDVSRALGSPESATVADRLRALPFTPEYFVITSFGEFNRHHQDLKEFLAAACRSLVESERYLVYGRCAQAPEDRAEEDP